METFREGPKKEAISNTTTIQAGAYSCQSGKSFFEEKYIFSKTFSKGGGGIHGY